VPAYPVPELLYVFEPDARESEAWRDPSDLADKSGAVPLPVPGFVVFARLVVGGVDERLLNEQAEALGLVAEPLGGADASSRVQGFFTIEATSVLDAVALAGELRDRLPEGADVRVDLRRPSGVRAMPSDPLVAQQWHLKNALAPGFSLNVEPVWGAGFTGAGVTIGIMENAFESTHPDLSARFNATASQSGGTVTGHATSVAGLAGASANNGIGGAGVAYGARLSRQIYGSASQNAAGFTFRNDLNFIRNSSWGPSDTGRITQNTPEEQAALQQAATQGRGGLGTVTTWAAGNGDLFDRVDFDPYASSRFVISIGAIGDDDTRAWYNEIGSSMFAVAQSGGASRGLTTSNIGATYTSGFTGTSGSAPQAAGLVALLLQARPDLTFRDVRHVLARSARRCDPQGGWEQNDAGVWIHYGYGFGALDAGAAMNVARGWTRVGPETLWTSGKVSVNRQLPDGWVADPVRATLRVSERFRVESVEVILNVTTTYVGDLEIKLVSPSGTNSDLKYPNPDDGTDNLTNVKFTSHRYLDELSDGDWYVTVNDAYRTDIATWRDATLVVTGWKPPDCVGDLDRSGFIDADDFVGFVTAFRAGWPTADVDLSGFVDSDDFASFVASFVEGCDEDRPGADESLVREVLSIDLPVAPR
jgi:subtilisin-like proprotein convertase family protein